MTPKTPKTPEIISGKGPETYSENSGISIDTGVLESADNRTQVDPWAREGVKQIKLGPSASKALTESGQSVFALVSRQRWPDDPQRWAIYLLPVPLALARQAEGVILGTHTARPIRKPATATTGTNTTPPPA